MTMNLINLPHEILILLRRYICYAKTSEQFLWPTRFLSFEATYYDSYRQYNEEEKEWSNFLNTSKSLRDLKRTTETLILSGAYTILFLEDATFRARVENLVADRSKQLHFHIQSSESTFQDKDYFHWNDCQGISMLYSKECIETAVLSNVRGLNLFQTTVKFICHFQNLLHLTIESCQPLKIVFHLPSLQRLFLKSCSSLQTIKDLPSLERLWIHDCHHLTILSVPPLDVLEILRCSLLKLSQEFIEATKTGLTLEFEDKEIEESFFLHLHHLQLLEIFQARIPFHLQATACSSIPTLSFSSCPHLVIDNLVSLQSLYLEQCDCPVIHFESLPALRILAVVDCDHLMKIEFTSGRSDSSYPSLIRVGLLNCSHLKKVIVKRKIRSLIIDVENSLDLIILNPVLVQSITVNSSKFLSRNGIIEMMFNKNETEGQLEEVD